MAGQLSKSRLHMIDKYLYNMHTWHRCGPSMYCNIISQYMYCKFLKQLQFKFIMQACINKINVLFVHDGS